MTPNTLLFDLGGVVLSNGWDHEQRARTAARFALDKAELEARHARLVDPLECGQLRLDDYLAQVVFDTPRPFTAAELTDFIFSCSQPNPETLELLGELAANGRLRLATLNNEGRELNQYRIAWFGLRRYFSVFCSSCYLGVRKPGPEIYRRALGILQADAAECLFIDDREENLAAPRALGIASLQFLSADQLRYQLGQRGLL
ncbi:MAG TPA: HAD family phosphatase [Terriglobales bacterium]|nr:HAD family phosphatase [Terriglobales bacterium]